MAQTLGDSTHVFATTYTRYIDTCNGYALRISTSGTERIYVHETNGNVGIGTTAPSEKLHVSGNILATGNVTAYSDRRLKSEIEDMAERAPLRPRTYVKDGRRQIGFIAQEVREAYPEAVTETQGEDHLLALDYGSLTAALAAQNNALRQRVERLEAMVERLMRERG